MFSVLFGMATSATVTHQEEITRIPESISDLPREQVERWCTACQEFLNWEREHILKRTPSDEESRQHKTTLKWLLRLTRLMGAAVSDPDFPDRKMVQMIEMTVWKLDDSWKMIYEPMPDADAEKLLAEVFPE